MLFNRKERKSARVLARVASLPGGYRVANLGVTCYHYFSVCKVMSIEYIGIQSSNSLMKLSKILGKYYQLLFYR